MESSSNYLIKRHRDHGWSITRCGEKMGATGNVVDAIDLANRLAERDHLLYQRPSRVVFVDDDPVSTPKVLG